MSSNADVNELVHEWVDACNRQDFDRFGAVLTDDVVCACGAFGLAFTGRDAFVGHIREYAGAVADRALTLERVIAEGDAVAVGTGFAGTGSGAHPGLPPAGWPVAAGFCIILHLCGGRIASLADCLGGR
ncbi:nuclear transport factor 2 family protein [Streptomyces olivoreticuli]